MGVTVLRWSTGLSGNVPRRVARVRWLRATVTPTRVGIEPPIRPADQLLTVTPYGTPRLSVLRWHGTMLLRLDRQDEPGGDWSKPLAASELVRMLGRAGWEVVRQRGSDWRLENPGRRQNAVTVAVHANRDLPEGTLRAISDGPASPARNSSS